MIDFRPNKQLNRLLTVLIKNSDVEFSALNDSGLFLAAKDASPFLIQEIVYNHLMRDIKDERVNVSVQQVSQTPNLELFYIHFYAFRGMSYIYHIELKDKDNRIIGSIKYEDRRFDRDIP